jgi:hypothetical protein
MGDLQQILGGIPLQVQAMVIRQTWNVHPHEEQMAYAQNPGLEFREEPTRTIMVRDWVQMQRDFQATQQPSVPTPGQPTVAPTPQATPQEGVQQRQTAPVVPYVEGGGGPNPTSDLQNSDEGEIAKLMAEYTRITQDTSLPVKERFARAKKVWEQIAFKRGLSHEQMSTSSWKDAPS